LNDNYQRTWTGRGRPAAWSARLQALTTLNSYGVYGFLMR